MKFVTGGCYQGKLQWVLAHENLLQSQAADGAVCSMEAINSAEVLNHFHLLVQRWILAEKNPSEEIETILEANPELVIITDEIGGGIVPMDPKEREWRGIHGRLCCQLAQKAECVIRVIAGIGQRIK